MLRTGNLKFLEWNPSQLPYAKEDEVTDAVVDLIADECLPIKWTEKPVSQQHYSQMEARLQEACQGQKNQQEASFKVDCTWLGIESLLPLLTI